MRWERYAVDKARYDDRMVGIEKICVHSITNGRLGPPRIWSRENLLHVLERGFEVIVIPAGKDLDGIDERRVQHLSVNREGYIRVNGEEGPADHLGDLPDI